MSSVEQAVTGNTTSENRKLDVMSRIAGASKVKRDRSYMASGKVETTWAEIEDWIRQLASLIEGKEYVGIYGLPKGGLIMATLLSYKTGLPMLMSPCKGCLVVDDDMSTGASLITSVGKRDIAVMFRSPECAIEPEYKYADYGEEYREFPWARL